MVYFDLFPNQVTENKKLEFKIRLNSKDIVGWLKTIAAFANTEGGDFVIGVKEGTYELQGFLRSEVDSIINYFINQVNLYLVPKPVLSFTYPSYQDEGETRYIIKIHVEKSSLLPVVLKNNGFSLIFVRGDGQTNPATPQQITDMVLLSGRYAYDTMFTDEIYQRNQFQKLFEVYRKRTGNELTEKFLSSINFFDSEYHLSKGALLFRDDCQENNTDIQCAKWPGVDKGSNLIPQMFSYRGNILSGIEFMIDFIRRNSDEGYLKTASGRENVSSFPERSVLEGVVNAVAHRNYYLAGSLLEVNVFRDRLEITSPGSFLVREKFFKDMDLAQIRPMKRNVLLCDVLAKCRLMEKDGSGFDLIVKDYQGQDKGHMPFVSSDEDSFTLTLPNLIYVGVVDKSEGILPPIVFPPRQGKGSSYDEKILSYCYANKRTINDIANLLGLKVSTHLRKDILGSLVDDNYLYAVLEGKSIVYQTNDKVVRLI